MTLQLVMIRCPAEVAPGRREVRSGEFNIGRGSDNDWVIADPERHLSKRHCRVAFRSGGWELSDLSSNGTYLNHATAPIGLGGTQKLRSGDRIRFGSYEIEVTIDEAEQAARDAPLPGYALRSTDMLDPFASVEPASRRSEPDSLQGTGSDLRLPEDFNPLAPRRESFTGPTQSDHAPALDGAFRPPPVAVIPDDWDLDAQAAPVLPADPPRQAPKAYGNATPAPTIQPQASPHQGAPIQGAPIQATSVSAQPPSDATLVAAFLRGAGLANASLQDPEKTLEQVGAIVRAAVRGIRQTLMARATVKDEFRIEQTMIRATGNNPLKFSVDDDDALATLLGLGRRSAIVPEKAIAEAFEDVQMHELATISAMQSAVRVLLAQFEPAAIETKAGGKALLSAQKKARAWDAFAQLHQNVTQALSDDFDSVFGKAFARAYEQAIDELPTHGRSS